MEKQAPGGCAPEAHDRRAQPPHRAMGRRVPPALSQPRDILVATKKDFETQQPQEVLQRALPRETTTPSSSGTRQFEKIPVSPVEAPGTAILQRQKSTRSWQESKHGQGAERANATRSSRLEQSPGNRWRPGWPSSTGRRAVKDDVVTFEQLGVSTACMSTRVAMPTRTLFLDDEDAQRGRHCPRPKPRSPATCT